MAANDGKKGKVVSDSELRFGGEVDGDGTDRFSLLPDCLLVFILSFLPLEDFVRTSVLSSRWRHLWTIAPLRLLDDCALRSEKSNKKPVFFPAPHDEERWRAEEGWRVRAIGRVLSAHAGPIERCRFSCMDQHIPLLDGWIQTLGQKGVQDLSLLIPKEKRFYLVPTSLITCQSLISLELHNCRFPRGTLPGLNLVNLRDLKLFQNLMTDAAVHDFLSGCPALQNLVLVHCAGLRRIHLRSPTLCSMTLRHYSLALEKLFVVDAPSLESLTLCRTTTARTHVKILNAPKLEILGSLDMNIKMLELGTSCFKFSQRSLVSKSSTLLWSLKKLGVRMRFRDVLQARILFDLLKCFPCLETLDAWVVDVPVDGDATVPDLGFWEKQGSLDCVDRHLKSVTVKGFLGQKADLGFVNFVITRARALKVVTLISFHARREEWVESTRRHLCLESKASMDAEVVFQKQWHDIRLQAWSSPGSLHVEQ